MRRRKGAANGYGGRRRAIMWNIGSSLLKQNRDGYYRARYLERKTYEILKAQQAGLMVAPAAKIPGARAAEFMSEGHVHNRARRYMEKRLLLHLWKAWRAARIDMPDPAVAEVPHVTPIAPAAAEVLA